MGTLTEKIEAEAAHVCITDDYGCGKYEGMMRASQLASSADELIEEIYSVLRGCQIDIQSKARIEQVLNNVDAWKARMKGVMFKSGPKGRDR